MYMVELINFGSRFYDYATDWAAFHKAESTGYESNVYRGNELIATYSPISGWRKYQ